MYKLIILGVLIGIALLLFGLYKRTRELTTQAKQEYNRADKSKVIDLDEDEWAREEREKERDRL